MEALKILGDILEKYNFRLSSWHGKLTVTYGNGVKFSWKRGRQGQTENRRGSCFGDYTFTATDLAQADQDLMQVEEAGQDAVIDVLLWGLVERYGLNLREGELMGRRAEGQDRRLIRACRDRIIIMLGGVPGPRVKHAIKHRSIEPVTDLEELIKKYKPRLRYEAEAVIRFRNAEGKIKRAKKIKGEMPNGEVIISYTFLGERIREDMEYDHIKTEKFSRESTEIRTLENAEPKIKDMLLREIIKKHKVKLKGDRLRYPKAGCQVGNIIMLCESEIIKILEGGL